MLPVRYQCNPGRSITRVKFARFTGDPVVPNIHPSKLGEETGLAEGWAIRKQPLFL
jgi:hypothetical protein